MKEKYTSPPPQPVFAQRSDSTTKANDQVGRDPSELSN